MSKGKTAAEIMAELERDPAYLARRAELERIHLEGVNELRKELAPIVQTLESMGVKCSSLDEVPVNGTTIPVLLEALPLLPSPNAKEVVVRLLSRPPKSTEVSRVLVAEFRSAAADHSSLRWAIGNALEIVADDGVFEDVVSMAQDRRYGRSREMVALALGKMKDPRAVEVLLGLLSDPDVHGHAVMALGRSRDPRARTALEPFLGDKRAWVRKEARKSIAKLDRALKR